MRHVFLIGSNGIPASYGGFETFVEQLTAHRKDQEIFIMFLVFQRRRENLNIITRVVFKLRFQSWDPQK